MSMLTASAQHDLPCNMPFGHDQDFTFPPSSHISSNELVDDSPHGSPRLSAPIPNPPFIFPAREPTVSGEHNAPRGGRRRPMSTYELRSDMSMLDSSSTRTRTRPPPLPSFSFNPAGNDGTTSPPKSPRSPGDGRPIPARPGGHRRGGSEFIGGDGKSGAGLGLMSTSPTKGDGVLPAPLQASALGPGRRGHAHRRSAAMSCHDLSMVLKPTNPSSVRAGSAPTSPADNAIVNFSFPASTSLNTSSTSLPAEEAPAPPPVESPSRATRTRVGFSDAVEYIPRPLSLVSTDTSSTTTFKGHSVHGSISSIISIGTSSPSTRDARVPMSPSVSDFENRPKTAGFVLDAKPEPLSDIQPAVTRRASNPSIHDLSPATSSAAAARFPHKYLSADAKDGRPTSSASSDKGNSSTCSSVPTSPALSATEGPAHSADESDIRSFTKTKNKKKVKHWAGSILSRKARNRNKKALTRRSPTPPATSELLEQVLDAAQDTTHITRPELPADVTSWKPRKVSLEDDSMSPIIDLDAALGPFNTPSHDPLWDASQRNTFGVNKRRMHSAAGMGGFSGPGMHYHRRTESAPEMIPFDAPRWGLNRFGSSSTMADVFEEDEDEMDEPSPPAQPASDADEQSEAATPELPVAQFMDAGAERPESRGVKRKGSGLSDPGRDISAAVSPQRPPAARESNVEDDNSAAPAPVEAAPVALTRPKELAPVEILSEPNPPFKAANSPSTIHSASPCSPMSYDANHISTAPSSIAEENGFHALLLGEPGPEIRNSVDEPSLYSNGSIRARDSLHLSHSPLGSTFREGQRSSSISSASALKRSSIASISRLISSSHGEKSKLSIEERPPSSPERRSKKNNRFSRMMQFFKPKDEE